MNSERRDTRSAVGFFFVAHVVLLGAVFAGFSPTFYLRPFHKTTPLPFVLYLHGAVLTGWFLITVLQSLLIRTKRHGLHRRVGFVVAGYAALVVIMGLLADARMASEILSPQDGDIIVVWGNLFSLVLFTIYVVLAVAFRGNPEAHRRLILIASISIIGPALARFSEWPIFPGGMAARPFYGVGGLLLLLAALLTYDLIVRRRPHPVSWIGTLAMLTSLAIAVFLTVSGIGFRILHGA